MTTTTQLPVTVYSEMTPNPETMKFVTDRMLLPDESIEINSLQQADNSPLAQALFGFPFVKGLFIMNNFITILKERSTDWYEIVPPLREFIKLYLDEDKPVFNPGFRVTVAGNAPHASDDDIVLQVKEALDKYVKPAVEMDGGAIHFKSYHDGIVTVTLKGACSGCPSSNLTLKSGIENLLKRMIPEIKEVIAQSA